MRADKVSVCGNDCLAQQVGRNGVQPWNPNVKSNLILPIPILAVPYTERVLLHCSHSKTPHVCQVFIEVTYLHSRSISI